MVEPEFLKVLDKYVSVKTGRIIFWVFVILGIFALLTPVLINLRNIWENVDWIMSKLTGTPLTNMFVSLLAIASAFAMLAGIAWIFAVFTGMFIRISFATPTHWRLESVLEQTIYLLQAIRMQGYVSPENLNSIDTHLKNAEDLYKYWQESRVTKVVHWFTKGIKRRRKA